MYRKTYQLHKYIGLVLAAWVFVQAITGIIIVYRHELGGLIQPGAYRVVGDGAWSSHAVHDLLLRQFPERSVIRMDFPKQKEDAVFVTMKEVGGTIRYATVDQYTLNVTAEGSIWQFPIEVAFELHHALFMGEAGKKIVGVFGLLLLLAVSFGVILWWPKNGRWKKAFRVRFSGSLRTTLRELHRSVGAAISLLIILSCITGVAIVFSAWIAQGLARFMPYDMPPQVKAADQVPSLTIDEAVTIAARMHLHSKVRDIRFSDPSGLLVRVLLTVPESANPRALHQVWVDRASGVVAAQINGLKLPLLNRALSWLLPLHSGEFGGNAGRVVMALSGLGLLAVSLFGLVIWYWNRQLIRRKR